MSLELMVNEASNDVSLSLSLSYLIIIQNEDDALYWLEMGLKRKLNER
jgi:hypothetical protein